MSVQSKEGLLANRDLALTRAVNLWLRLLLEQVQERSCTGLLFLFAFVSESRSLSISFLASLMVSGSRGFMGRLFSFFRTSKRWVILGERKLTLLISSASENSSPGEPSDTIFPLFSMYSLLANKGTMSTSCVANSKVIPNSLLR